LNANVLFANSIIVIVKASDLLTIMVMFDDASEQVEFEILQSGEM
jgi:hypothetical protein